MFSFTRQFTKQGREITESDKKIISMVFEKCDEDKKGYLSREDVKMAVVMLFGYKPSKSETNFFMEHALRDSLPGRGFLTMEDFQKAFSRAAPRLPRRTVQEAFREVDRDSDGHVSFKDFELAVRHGRDNL